jgi:propanol-preferring alcohol dehydrogenase
VFVLTRTASHQRLSLEMGAVWAGADPSRLPEKVDSAILFAPIGSLVPPVLEALDKGGTLAIAGIHLSDLPNLNYERHLFYDKELRSVAANTREDGRQLLSEAVQVRVKPRVTAYPLDEANRALQEMKQSRIDGTGVLIVGE